MSGKARKMPLTGGPSLQRATGDVWEYTEFMSQQGTWEKARRTIYSRLIVVDTQLSLPGMGHDSVIITNIGMGSDVDDLLRQACEEHQIRAHSILSSGITGGVMMNWQTRR